MSNRHLHPWVFMVLILPFGIMSGYLTVTIGWQLKQAGISVEAIAGLIAISYIPHTWKFAWAPIADTTLTRKTWYVIACLLSAAGIVTTGLVPPDAANVPLLTGIVLASNFAVTFVAMSTESMMAYGVPDEAKGRVGGWFQAGNLGGAGLGGGAGLWLAQHWSLHAGAGLVLGAACALCCLVLPLLSEPATHRHEGGLGASLLDVGRDLWRLASGRIGFVALFLCFLPIGSGAAAGLWSAVAGDWGASADTVALVTGVLAGLLSAAGCLLGGWICDRMDRKQAYLLFGVLQATCAVAMGVLPHTEAMYVVMTSLYAVIMGLTYAGFTAFVLEAMGLGAAATKYSLFASLSNTPIAYMTSIDGWAHGRFGPAGMLFTEAVVGLTGLALFLVVRAIVGRGLLGASRLHGGNAPDPAAATPSGQPAPGD